jgi:hypothetical protein
MSPPSYAGAAQALRDRGPAVIERWLAAYSRSRLRLPHPVDAREFNSLARSVIEPLGHGLEEGAMPGAASLREAEKAVAFAGGSLGMSGANAFDVAAFTTTLRDVLADEARGPGEPEALERLFDWLSALAHEAFSTSARDSLQLHYRETLENGTPVVTLANELPAAFLVGEPDRSVMEATLGRLLLSVVRVGARAVLIDATGLLRPESTEVLEALRIFAAHPKVGDRVTIVVTGLAATHEKSWREAMPPPASVVNVERFDDALARALGLQGLEITRRRDPSSQA